MNAAIIWDEAYAEHDTGDHPEGTDRVTTVVHHLETTDLWPRLTVVKPRPATAADILLVHTSGHLDRVRAAAERGGGWLDPDTQVSSRSYEVALLAAGGAIEATALWSEGLVSFALIRPPGHHATRNEAMGFCLFNNIAIAAARLLRQGYERVAIVDWDVHHGNGTQDAFGSEPRVLFCSLHQWPLYPGSGDYGESGKGEALGHIVNIPLPAGSGDGDYLTAFDEIVLPILDQYDPQALLVSAGMDSHRGDPLGGMLVTDAGFAAMALRLLRVAQGHCDGRLAFILEGGYDRRATATGVEAVVGAVLDERAPQAEVASPRAAPAIKRARQIQAAYWRL
jgi:acetoin utilization deacetylase AcuC-like enzyme